jgi:hypothetical protein
MKLVVDRYPRDQLFTEEETEAQRILSNLGAGPLEGVLAAHGADFIGVVEVAARRDPKMRWTLGCVWQNAMPDDIWVRVQRDAGGISR